MKKQDVGHEDKNKKYNLRSDPRHAAEETKKEFDYDKNFRQDKKLNKLDDKDFKSGNSDLRLKAKSMSTFDQKNEDPRLKTKVILNAETNVNKKAKK